MVAPPTSSEGLAVRSMPVGIANGVCRQSIAFASFINRKYHRLYAQRIVTISLNE